MDTIILLQGDVDSSLTPLWLIHAISGLSLPYLALGELSDDDHRPVFGISSPIYTDRSYHYPSSLHDLAQSYVDLIREVQPHGPYLLGGWSMGGMIAINIAGILEKEGENILHVILIDSINPDNVPPFTTKKEHETVVDLTYSRLLTNSSALTRPGLQRSFSSWSSDGGDSPPYRTRKNSVVRVTVRELDSPSSSGDWPSTPSPNEFDTWDLSQRRANDALGGMPDGNYEEDAYTNTRTVARPIQPLEVVTLMREHISKGLGIIARKKGRNLEIAAPITLFKCSILEKLSERLSSIRRQSIEANFAHGRLGWKFAHIQTIAIGSAHDRVLDTKHAAELTFGLKSLLQKCA